MQKLIREIQDFKNSIQESIKDKIVQKFRTVLLDTDINKNARLYPLPVLKLAAEGINKKIQARKAWGGDNHPEGNKNLATKDVSHILTKAEVKDEKLYIEGQILKDTLEGQKILSMISVGTIGISARGAGTMTSKKDDKGKSYNEVNTDYRLLGADFVPDQSVDIATVSRDSLFESAPVEIKEEKFFSLRAELESAIKAKAGKKAWIQDFSNEEVIYRVYTDGGEINAEGEDIYYKINYKISGNEVELTGDAKKVERNITYENEMTKDERLYQCYLHEVTISQINISFENYKKIVKNIKS